MESALYNEMYAVEDRHWWFRARRKIVCHTLARLTSPSTGSKPRLLDLGCGCGANLAAYAEHFDAWGMDFSHPAVAFAQRRVGSRVCVGALPNELPFQARSFDVVVMTDVLEHLDDDRSAVASAMTLLRDGGIFLATVPAGQWLFAPRDVAHHHRRRYARRSLGALFDGLPGRIELLSHYHCALFAPAAAARLWSRLRGQTAVTDLHVPTQAVNRMLEAAFCVERHCLSWMRLPVGLSLICAVRKVAPSHASATSDRRRMDRPERVLLPAPLTTAP